MRMYTRRRVDVRYLCTCMVAILGDSSSSGNRIAEERDWAETNKGLEVMGSDSQSFRGERDGNCDKLARRQGVTTGFCSQHVTNSTRKTAKNTCFRITHKKICSSLYDTGGKICKGDKTQSHMG